MLGCFGAGDTVGEIEHMRQAHRTFNMQPEWRRAHEAEPCLPSHPGAPQMKKAGLDWQPAVCMILGLDEGRRFISRGCA